MNAIERMMSGGLTTLTRHGFLRRWVARVRRDWLFLLDVSNVLRGYPVGVYVWVWNPQEWSVETLSALIVERIRRAPRPFGETGFRLQVGEDAEDALEEEWNATNTPLSIQTFLSGHATHTGTSIRLLLVGEIFAAALRRNGWTA